MMTFGTIEQAIEDLRNGKIVIVADDEDRENEGDLVCAAELVTPEMINFMAQHGRGLICLALTGGALRPARPAADDRAELRGHGHRVHRQHRRRAAVRRHDRASPRPTAPPPSRSPSIPATVPADLRRPGHVFPLRARPGRRAAAGGTDRGERGPGPAGRAAARRRDLRDPECRRHHGPAARARGVRAAASGSPS